MTRPRHTADSITDDDLDQLYTELERMKLLVAASSEDGQAVRMAAQYAERAIENGERAERAEAALNAVRAELTALNSETTGLNPYAMAGRRDAVARVRAALDTHTNPR